jgi:hypothetical protein
MGTAESKVRARARCLPEVGGVPSRTGPARLLASAYTFTDAKETSRLPALDRAIQRDVGSSVELQELGPDRYGRSQQDMAVFQTLATESPHSCEPACQRPSPDASVRDARFRLKGKPRTLKGIVSPQLQSWIRDVIVPGLVDAYCGQMKEAPANPVEALAPAREVLQTHERDEERESSEGT